jgi:hypothetical protein
MIPWQEIFLIVSTIFGVIYAWPIWAPPYEPWRNRSFAISWVFFLFWIIAGGALNGHR